MNASPKIAEWFIECGAPAVSNSRVDARALGDSDRIPPPWSHMRGPSSIY